MANPQLVSYIKQQLQTGETESPIKSSLKSVGWPDADIEEAFKSASSSDSLASAPISSPVQASPSQPLSSPQVSASSSSSKPFSPMSSFNTPSGSASSAVASKVSINPMQTQNEPKKIDLTNFAPMGASAPGASSVGSFSSQKPVEASFSTNSSSAISPVASFSSAKDSGGKKGSVIMTVLMGLVILAFAGLSVMLFLNNKNLKDKVVELTSQLGVVGNIETETPSVPNNSSNEDMDKLKEEVIDLDSQLALFLPLRTTTSTVNSSSADPNSSSTSSSTPTIVTTPVPLTLGGKLGGGVGKALYTLTTSKGITVNLKNSKDAKVEALLKPLLGTPVELTGTPTAGAREITVTHVNGALIQ